MRKSSYLILAFALTVLDSFGQNMVINQLLDRPINVTVIKGDTFLQRDLTDYLKITAGLNNQLSNSITTDESNWIIIKDYLMRPHPNVYTINKYFKQASIEFAVPVSLLRVIGQVENNWTQSGPRIDQGWGIMHLVKNGYCNTLEEASLLNDVSEQVLKDDALQNIRGAAALIAKYAGENRFQFEKLEDWFPALAKFSGLISPELRALQAKNYFESLKNGVKAQTLWGEEIIIEKIDEINLDILYQSKFNEIIPLMPTSSDYGPALTNWATTCNWEYGRDGYSINTWVNHYTDGTYYGTISWFQTCPCPSGCVNCTGYRPCGIGPSSAHFVIKNSNGEITQMVAVENTAWHCGASGFPANNHISIGAEHEVLSSNPSMWNSAPMLNASATMACYFQQQYGFPSTQNVSPGICGHKDMPGTNTLCPGPLPWSTWFSYFNSAGCGTPQSVLCNNDECNGAVMLSSNTTCQTTSCSVNNALPDYGTAPGECDSYTGTILGAGVWFEFQAVSTSHTITVDPTGNLDAVLILYEGDCYNLNELDCWDEPGVGVVTSLTYNNLAIGDYYTIRVYDFGNVNCTSGGFDICVTHEEGCTDQFEPNNDCSTATSVFANPLGSGSSNYTINANIGYAGDQDWFKIQLTSYGTLTINLSNLPYNYDIELYGIGCSQWIDGGYNGGTNSEQIIYNSTTSNLTTLYVKVYANNSSNYTTATCYDLNFHWTSANPPCTLTVTPSNQNVPYTAGNTNFSVNSSCSWTAVSNSTSWCSVTPSGSGNGTITATFTQNPSTIQRVANITVTATGANPVTVSVTQEGAPTGCTLTVTPSNQNVPYTAGNTNFSVNSNCSWTAVSNSTSWCSVTPSGSGNGTITATFTQNPSTIQRVANITVTATGANPVTVSVTQEGAPAGCTLTVTPSNQNVPYTAGNTNFSVNSNCSWTAVSNSTSWCSVTPSGSGNGTITGTFTQNPSTIQRVANITVTATGANPVTVSVTQEGAPAGCTLTVTPSNQNVPYTAGNTNFSVNSNCSWTAVSNSTSWCSVTPSGSGNGTITATFTQNPSTIQRVANITVTATGANPVTVSVTQEGAPAGCTLTVTPSNQNVPYTAGNTNFSVNSSCSWTAVSNSTSWCSVTPSGSGNGTITATFTQNPSTIQRVANITVTATGANPVTVSVTQEGAPAGCTLTVTPSNQNVPYTAGNTNFSVNSNCSWTAVSNSTSWCSVTPSGSGNGTITGTFTQNPSTIQRVANITVTATGANPVTVSVTQEGVPAGCTLTVTPSNQNVPYTAGNTNFSVNSNCSWTAVSNSTSWCSVTPSGSGNGTITATFTQNSSTTQRVANITITAAGANPVTITVTQADSYGQQPITDFSGNPTSGISPLNVTFMDLSINDPTTWYWDFGDGNIGIAQHPTHTYYATGSYTVSLKASNFYGDNTTTKTNYITVADVSLLHADFTASPTSGKKPLTVYFTDLSSSATNYAWQFGDGNGSSVKNPTYTYSNNGDYTVSLKVTNQYGEDTETKIGYIHVSSGQSYGECDTLKFPLIEPLTYYIIDGNNGYVAGNNTFKDKAIAEYFDEIPSNLVITGLIFEFSVAKQGISNNEKVPIQVWKKHSSMVAPGEIILSDTILLSKIVSDVTQHKYTTIDFSNTIQPDGPFFAGIVLPIKVGDTTCLWSTQERILPVNTTWILDKDGIWSTAENLYSPTSGPRFIISSAVYPKTCKIYGVDEYYKKSSFSVWPNPAQDIIYVLKDNDIANDCAYSIIDVSGKTIFNGKLSDQIVTSINIGNLNPGLYIIKFSGKSFMETYKLIVN